MMSPFVIPVVALMIPMVVVPTALWFRHRLRVREMEHAERLRALELGVKSRPDSGLTWPGAALCIAVGAIVPIGSMLVAWLAVLTETADGQVFGIALIVSCTALWAAKSLAEQMISGRTEATEASAPTEFTAGAAKPSFDPDAYDVVGSRG